MSLCFLALPSGESATWPAQFHGSNHFSKGGLKIFKDVLQRLLDEAIGERRPRLWPCPYLR
ncbi:hypothetical protein BC826DRAFT_1048947 [Russula brevipes]|nr:hypothetical protein BC826DRAFT_1048947 [Russula brevipes]